MVTLTEKLAITQRRCFKEDAPRIQKLGKVLEAREASGRFNSEHVIRRALNALSRELGMSETARA
jgi:hypothetical protein